MAQVVQGPDPLKRHGMADGRSEDKGSAGATSTYFALSSKASSLDCRSRKSLGVTEKTCRCLRILLTAKCGELLRRKSNVPHTPAENARVHNRHLRDVMQSRVTYLILRILGLSKDPSQELANVEERKRICSESKQNSAFAAAILGSAVWLCCTTAATAADSGQRTFAQVEVEPAIDSSTGNTVYLLTPLKSPFPSKANQKATAPLYLPLYPLSSTVSASDLNCQPTNCDHANVLPFQFSGYDPRSGERRFPDAQILAANSLPWCAGNREPYRQGFDRDSVAVTIRLSPRGRRQ